MTFHWDKALIATAILIVAFGLPLSFFARKLYQSGNVPGEAY
jgi:hypothetical protein